METTAVPFKKGDPRINRKGPPKGAARRSAKLTDEQRKILANTAGGISPLEFLASIIRDEKATLKDKMSAAAQLMPYMHRKMPTAVDIQANTVVTTVSGDALSRMKPDELEALLKAVSAITNLQTVSVSAADNDKS
jgi:hypothetical protein